MFTLLNIWMNRKSLMKHHCNLNMEDITDAGYVHAKRVVKTLK